jgi:RNA polymerase sigma-70 factor (ECF subfamily)
MGDKAVDDSTTDPKNYEWFVQLLTRHERGIRAYIRAGLPSSQDVAEVMQEVSLIAWRKFSDLENPETDFARWATVIARYEIMKFRRTKARDRLVLGENIVEMINAEGIEESHGRESQLSALETCLKKLPEDRRELVLDAHVSGTSITEMADRIGKTRNALYQLLWRIRQELAECVEREEARST